MRKFIANSVNMIRAVLQYLTANTAATAGIAAFAGVKTQVDNKMILIDNLGQIANVSSEGVTLDTNLIRAAMEAIAFRIANSVRAYATSVNNNTLKQKVKYSKTNLKDMRKEEIDDTCQEIHDVANANIAAAGPFGYVAQDVTDLQTAIDLYRTSVQNPRQAIITKNDATDTIETIVKDIKENFFKEQIDLMVKTLEETNPEFVRKYFDNREIIDLGATHAKLRGTVKDVNDVPLIGVSVILRKTGTIQIVKQTLTIIKGAYTINQIPADDYDFFWVFSGYKTVREDNVHVSLGKELQRKIVLEEVNGSTAQQVAVNASQIVVLDSNLQPTDAGSAYFKNSSPAGVSLNIYFAANPNDPFSGTGITLTSGQEVVVDSDDIGPIQPYLLVQNTGPFNGSLDFTKLS